VIRISCANKREAGHRTGVTQTVCLRKATLLANPNAAKDNGCSTNFAHGIDDPKGEYVALTRGTVHCHNPGAVAAAVRCVPHECCFVLFKADCTMCVAGSAALVSNHSALRTPNANRLFYHPKLLSPDPGPLAQSFMACSVLASAEDDERSVYSTVHSKEYEVKRCVAFQVDHN
jgi:hypothetical protein